VNLSLRPRIRALLLLAARLAIYAFATGMALEVVVARVRAGNVEALVSEDGAVELAQLLLVFSAAGVLLSVIVRGVRDQELRILMGMACLFAGIRELDGFFGAELGPNAYKLFAIPVVLAGVVVGWRGRAALLEQLIDFAATPAAALLFAGALIVLVHAQVLGQKELWQTLVPGPGARTVKKTVEECSELTGYLVILFAAIEIEIQRRHRAPR
jgi:hypothetical protein